MTGQRGRGRIERGIRAALVVAVLLLACGSAAAAPSGPAGGARTGVDDLERRADINLVNLFVSNVGSFGWDVTRGLPGLYWPTGSDRSAMFAGGLWLMDHSADQFRITLAEYSSEYTPGPMVGGAPSFPNSPQNRVYKVVPWTGNPADSARVMRTAAELAAGVHLDPLRHDGWTDWWSGTWPGGPVRFWRLPNTATPQPGDSIDVPGPDVIGDQMLWSVFNDADPARHTHPAGRSPPLYVEVQMSAFSFLWPEPLASTVFLRYRLINKGPVSLDSMTVGLWADADLGQASDDLVGCDVPRALGYSYNAYANDGVYGTPAPAVGMVLLRGPVNANGDTLGLSAFSRPDDPSLASHVIGYMRGLNADGSEPVDPTTGLGSRFFAHGDPVRGLGWLDSLPGDRRMLLASGPFQMAPGDTQEILAAVLVGRAGDHLASVGALRCAADAALGLYRNGFDRGSLADWAPCSLATPYVTSNCPRSSEFWRAECAFGGTLLTPAQIAQIAACVNGSSTLFDWAPGAETTSFCEVMNPAVEDARSVARREYAAMLANLCAGTMGLTTADGDPVWLNRATTAACPTLPAARTLSMLARPADLTPEFLGGQYLNLDQANRRALDGIGAGLPSFTGGAGPSSFLPGSALDPVAHADSFTTAEIRFDGAQLAYRYLRLERASDGAAPPQGRGWLYGGFRNVPFTVWDVSGNRQLDAAFVERVLTDSAGTILPPGSQPATFDSTWAPDTSQSGGHEYLVVFNRPHSRTARPAFAANGFLVSGAAPSLYTLAARRRAVTDVIDPGDAFRFDWGLPRSPGADSLLIALESRPLDEPDVAAGYDALSACLGSLNRGDGLGAVCGGTLPAAISVQEVERDRSHVTVTWYTVGAIDAAVERRFENEGWSTLTNASAGPNGTLAHRDDTVAPGGRYTYRLAVNVGAGVQHFGAVTVDVPGESAFRVIGARPNPATQDLVLAFSLANREPAKLELIDITGRRVHEQDLVGLGAGEHTLNLGVTSRFRAGIYMVRITQAGRRTSGKVALVH